MTDLQAQLAAAFAAELAEHLAAIRAGLALAAAGGQGDLRDMFRRAHSLKGAARAVDRAATERHAHALEAVLAEVEQGRRALDAGTIAEVRAALDAIEDTGGAREPAATDDAPAAAAPALLRVSGTHVERLARSVAGLAEEVRARAAVAGALIGIEAELAALIGLATSGAAARRANRVAADVARLRRAVGQAQWSLDRAMGEVERDAERIMLLPAASLFDGYERMVRELAAAQGKAVTFQIAPSDAEADRRVLQGLRDPVMHLLRNAIGHGIETPAVRAAAGKPAQGVVTVAAIAHDGELIVTVADDGAGLDHARIEREARRAGLIEPGETPTRAALEAAIFAHRFSTARGIDEISGRGVGLAVVADAVRRLHARVSIAAGTGGGGAPGTIVTIAAPLGLARQTLVLVECAGEVFAVPAGAVTRVLRVARTDVHEAGGRSLAAVDGETLPVVALAGLLGLFGLAGAGTGDAGGDAGGDGGDNAGGDHHQALLLGEGAARTLVVVDRLIAVRRGHVGDAQAIAADLDHLFGTLILDDGAVALVLDPRALLALAARGGSGLGIAPVPPAARQRTILVVDDSVTTRTLERTILEGAGYRVVQSIDGIDGLARLRASLGAGTGAIDLVVADVEMPRMDGFGLLSAIRNDPAFANIPVVMMTSRNSPDDIERGLTLGANAYATKQDFDSGGLLAIVGQWV